MNEPLTGATQADYARHRGVSRPYVHRLYHEGALVLNADGTINVAASDAALAAAHDPTRGGKGGGGILTRAARAEAEEGAASLPEVPNPADSVSESKRLSAYYKAKKDESDYRQSIKELVELPRLRSGNAAAFGAVSRALGHARIRLAPLTAATSDEHRTYELLGKEFDAILTELADALAAMADQMTATSQ